MLNWSRYKSLKNNLTDFNLFSLFVFLFQLSQSLISIFIPIYFYKLGLPIIKIIFFYFLVEALNTIFFINYPKYIMKLGYKKSLLCSIPFLIIYNILLIFLPNNMWLFYILPLLNAMKTVFYNMGHHLSFVTFSDKNKIGRNISLLGIISIIVSILSPYISGLLSSFNFTYLYIASIIILLFSLIPLIFIKSSQSYSGTIKISNIFKKIFSKSERNNLISFCGYATEVTVDFIIWPIFTVIMFTSLEKTGLVISLTALVGIITYRIIGILTDSKDKINLIRKSNIFLSLSLLLRIFISNPISYMVLASIKNVTEKVTRVPWSAQGYELAKKENYFDFILRREVIFHGTRIFSYPLFILIFKLFNNPFVIIFIVGAITSLGYSFIQRE